MKLGRHLALVTALLSALAIASAANPATTVASPAEAPPDSTVTDAQQEEIQYCVAMTVENNGIVEEIVDPATGDPVWDCITVTGPAQHEAITNNENFINDQGQMCSPRYNVDGTYFIGPNGLPAYNCVATSTEALQAEKEAAREDAQPTALDCGKQSLWGLLQIAIGRPVAGIGNVSAGAACGAEVAAEFVVERLLPVASIVDQMVASTFGVALRAPLFVIMSALFGALGEEGNIISQTPADLTYDSPAVQRLYELSQIAAFALLGLIATWGGVGIMLRAAVRAPYPDAPTLLGKLILAAFGIVFGIWIMEILIELNNGAICAFGAEFASVSGSGQNVCNDAKPPGFDMAFTASQSVLVIFFSFGYALVLIVLVVLMAMRIALIDILIILAPLAAALWVLPQTETWAGRWWNLAPLTVFQQFGQMLALMFGVTIVATIASPVRIADIATGPTLPGMDAADPDVVAPILHIIFGYASLWLVLKMPGIMQGQALQAGAGELLGLMSGGIGNIRTAGAAAVRAGSAGAAAASGAVGGASSGFRAARSAGGGASPGGMSIVTQGATRGLAQGASMGGARAVVERGLGEGGERAPQLRGDAPSAGSPDGSASPPGTGTAASAPGYRGTAGPVPESAGGPAPSAPGSAEARANGGAVQAGSPPGSDGARTGDVTSGDLAALPGGATGSMRPLADEHDPTPREAGQQAGERVGERVARLPAAPVAGAVAGAAAGMMRGLHERPAAQKARRQKLDDAMHEQMRHNRALAELNNPVTPQAEQGMRNAATIARFRDAARKNPDLVTPETAPFLPRGGGQGGGQSPLRRAQANAMRDQSTVARYRSATTGDAGADDPALSTSAFGSDAAGTSLPQQERAYEVIQSDPAFQTPEFDNHIETAAQVMLPPEQHSQLRDSHPAVWQSYTLSAVMGRIDADPAAARAIPPPARESIAQAWSRWQALSRPGQRQGGA